MPAAPGVASNYQLNERLYALQTILNSSHILHLFQNNITPDPSTPGTAFVESNFPGYPAGGISLANDFTAPTKVADGHYQIAGSSHAFSFTSGTSQTVYGWYLGDTGGNLRFSYLFATPVLMQSGVTLYVQVIVEDWSYVTVP